MPSKKIPVYTDDSNTRNKILDTATELFALKGYKTVTLKDIANAVGIRIASIYYYYEDKDALFKDVVLRFEEVFQQYHEWVSALKEKAGSLEEVIDSLFSLEAMEDVNPIARFGISIVLKERYNNEIAYQAAFKHIYDESTRNLQSCFDRLIEKKIIPPSDTYTLATLMMYCVTAGNEMRMYEFANTELSVDFGKVLNGLKILISTALAQGTLPTDA